MQFIFKNSNVYDILKWVVVIVMPAFVTLCTALFDTWNIPYGTQIVASISAIQLFLGAIIVKSSNDYRKVNS